MTATRGTQSAERELPHATGVRIVVAGLAAGATMGFVAAALTPAIRRWAGVTDRDLINGASVVVLSIGLWLLCSAVYALLASRAAQPLTWACGLAALLGAAVIIAIYGNIGPSLLTPYPTRFASLAVPLIVLVVAGGALLFPLALRWSFPALRTAAAGTLVAAVLAGGIVYATDRRPAVHYTLTTARSVPAAAAAAAQSTPALAGAPATPIATPAPVLLHFTVAQNSEASYTVNEKRAQLPAPDDAVGTTQSITGDVWLTSLGLDPNHPSSLTVDLRTLKSDQAGRDRAISTSALESNTFPFATYTIQKITGFPANYQQGAPVNVTLDGTFSVHGQEHPLTWTGSAVYDGTQLEVVMSTQFDMTTYAISPPNSAATVAQPGVKLDLHVYATKQPD